MSHETITPPDAKTRVAEGWTYVDVRTVEEFEAGHPTGAFNIPVAFRSAEMGRMQPNPEFVAVMMRAFAKDTKLVMGCAAGGRSGMACELLEAEGYTALANMHGGFSGARDPMGNVEQEGWEALGFPTETDGDPERCYEKLGEG